jgi:Methyltransferase FkbM domain
VLLCRLLFLVNSALVLTHLNPDLFKNCIVVAPTTDVTEPTKSPLDWTANSLQARNGRSTYHAVCNDPNATDESIVKAMDDWFVPAQSDSKEVPSRLPSPIFSCDYTFLDLGSNIGDSIGKFIDSGIGPCPNRNKPPKFSISQGVVGPENYKRNALTEWASIQARTHSKRIGRDLYPEDYCFYGVEGNPHFTKRLTELEDLVHGSTPRPLRHAHFFTESVGTKVDGPTTLYLDTVNTKDNFWGSSIHAQHKDVKKSAARTTDQAPVAVNVTGITLTTLVRQTTLKQAGNHLLVKMDIEGAEFDVLGEAFDSGVLCDYAKAGVQVDMVVEFHGETVMVRLCERVL